MSDETPRSDDSAPSLSSYPPAFASLIETFMKRAEDAETRAHKALVILKQKDGQFADLQQRLESLEKSSEQSLEKSDEQSLESWPDENCVPPLDLPQSSSSSRIEVGSPHPRQIEALKAMTKAEDPSLETLYKRAQSPPDARESTGDSTDCYIKCKKLLQDDMQRCNSRRLEKTQPPGIVEKKDLLESSQEQLTLPTALNSGTQMDTLNHSDGSGDRYEMVIIDRAAVKQSVDMAGSIINCIQQRLEEDGNKYPENKVSNFSSRDCFRHSSRSSVSSYHTPKSKFSSRFLIRRRKTTNCFFNSLNRAHRKLRLKYNHVCDKFKESLTLCGKLQDDIISLTECQSKMKEVEVSATDKQTQTQVATRSSTSLLQGRLEAASQAMRRRLAELQEVRSQLGESQSAVAALKKRLSRAESDVAMKDVQLVEATATNAAQSSQLQHLQHQAVEMAKTKQIVEDREEMFHMELEDLKRSTETKVGLLKAIVDSVDEKESRSAQVVEELEIRLKHLEAQLMLQIVEASERLTAADTKIRQLYLAIQTFLKMVFGMSRGAYCEKGQSDVDLHAMQVASEILQLQPAQLNGILQASTSANKWLRKCRRLLFEEDFAEKLGCLLVEAVFEARNS